MFSAMATRQTALGGSFSFPAVRTSRAWTVGLVILTCARAGTLPNDDCQTAIPVGHGMYAADNTGATTDGTASCGFAGVDGEADVWFVYTAPVDGIAVIDTCASDGPVGRFDSVLSVFDACGGTEIACNDDELDACALLSRVTINVVQGASYWIRVAEYRGRMGPFVLTIASPLCGNDFCTPDETHDTCPADCDTLHDFADFQVCFGGSDSTVLSGCEEFDFNGDDRVDAADSEFFVEHRLAGP